MNKSMIKAGLKKLISDYLAFTKNLQINKVVIVIVYINNFLFFTPDLIELKL